MLLFVYRVSHFDMMKKYFPVPPMGLVRKVRAVTHTCMSCPRME